MPLDGHTRSTIQLQHFADQSEVVTLAGTRTGEVFTFQAIEPIPSAILCWTYGPQTYPNIKTTSTFEHDSEHIRYQYESHQFALFCIALLNWLSQKITKGHALIDCTTGVFFHFSILKRSKCFAIAAFSSHGSLVASCSPQRPPAEHLSAECVPAVPLHQALASLALKDLTTFDSPFARLQRLHLMHQEPKQLHHCPRHKGCYNTNWQNIAVVVCGNRE